MKACSSLPHSLSACLTTAKFMAGNSERLTISAVLGCGFQAVSFGSSFQYTFLVRILVSLTESSTTSRSFGDDRMQRKVQVELVLEELDPIAAGHWGGGGSVFSATCYNIHLLPIICMYCTVHQKIPRVLDVYHHISTRVGT